MGFHMTISTVSSVAIYQRIYDQVLVNIANGNIYVGEQLPSIRMVSDVYELNHNTVHKAYQQLQADGIILIDRRAGAIIAPPKRREEYREQMEKELELHITKSIMNGATEKEYLQYCRDTFERVAYHVGGVGNGQ